MNICRQETEGVLPGQPAVLDAAVIGVPSEEFGEAVKAVVQLMPGQMPSPELSDRLIEFCRAQLSSLKCARSIAFLLSLPRSATGKVFKRKLRDEFWR